MNFFLKIFKLLPPELAHSISLNSLNLLYRLNLLSLFSQKIPTSNEFNFLVMTFKNLWQKCFLFVVHNILMVVLKCWKMTQNNDWMERPQRLVVRTWNIFILSGYRISIQHNIKMIIVLSTSRFARLSNLLL